MTAALGDRGSDSTRRTRLVAKKKKKKNQARPLPWTACTSITIAIVTPLLSTRRGSRAIHYTCFFGCSWAFMSSSTPCRGLCTHLGWNGLQLVSAAS